MVGRIRFALERFDSPRHSSTVSRRRGIWSLGCSRYEDIHMAFHIWVCAGLSGLLVFVLLFDHFHFFAACQRIASDHSTRSLSKYVDSFLSAALDYLRGGIVTPP